MIIISSSSPKSASTLIYNYQRDLLKLADKNNKVAQQKITEYSLVGGYFQTINFKVFLAIIFVNLRYGSIVIKTHICPNKFIKILIFLGLAKASFCYRDPRDAILSAIDHGERSRKGLDRFNSFKNIKTVQDAIPLAKSWGTMWYMWKEFNKVFLIRYEDLIEDKLLYLQQMNDYFNLNLRKEDLEQIYQKYENNKIKNFNKGNSQRYKEEMNVSDIILCNKRLKKILKDMKYSV